MANSFYDFWTLALLGSFLGAGHYFGLAALFLLPYQMYLIPTIGFAVPLSIMLLMENEEAPILVLVGAYLGFIQYFDIYDLANNISVNTLWVIPALAGYLLCGTLLSLVKWFIFIRRESEKARLTKVTPENRISFATKYVDENRVRIVRWILYWPLALINLLFGEIYKFFGNYIFNWLYSHFVIMTLRVIDLASVRIEEQNRPVQQQQQQQQVLSPLASNLPSHHKTSSFGSPYNLRPRTADLIQ